MSENQKRIISGAVLTILIAGFGLLGGPVLCAGCFALSVLAEKEFFTCTGTMDRVSLCVSYGISALFYIALFFFGESALLFAPAGAFIAFMFLLLWRYPETGIRESALSFTGFIYTGILFSFLYLVRKSGFALYAFVFVCSWLGDTFAYSIGRRFGKHKMIPLLSPKKSWEGFLAGLLGCTLLGILYGILFGKSLGTPVPVAIFAVTAFFGQLLSVAGDLSASAIKREFGMKDYSQLIPGHGGILDRFDSVLFAAPFVYFVFRILEKAVL